MLTVLASTGPDDIRKYRIIDCHEHIQSIKQAEKAITVMDRIGIDTVIEGEIDWSRMNVKKLDRKPGQAFSPTLTIRK